MKRRPFFCNVCHKGGNLIQMFDIAVVKVDQFFKTRNIVFFHCIAESVKLL